MAAAQIKAVYLYHFCFIKFFKIMNPNSLIWNLLLTIAKGYACLITACSSSKLNCCKSKYIFLHLVFTCMEL